MSHDRPTTAPRSRAPSPMYALSWITTRSRSTSPRTRTFDPSTVYSPSRVPASTRQPGADHRRPDDLRVGIDLRALTQPHRLGDLEAGKIECDLPVEHIHVGAEVRVEGADVLPVARRDRADQRLPLGRAGGEHVAREVDRLVPIDVVEDLRVEHVDAGVDGVAEDLTPRGLLEEPLDRAVVAGDDDAELERVLDVGEADGGHRLPLVVERDDLAEVDVGEDVAGDHEEALVEQLARRCRPIRRCRAACSRSAYVIVTPNSEPSPK